MVFKSDYPKFDHEAAPDAFDPAKPYADPVAMPEHRENLHQVERDRILRQRLQQRCYSPENATLPDGKHQKCRPLIHKYMAYLQNIATLALPS